MTVQSVSSHPARRSITWSAAGSVGLGVEVVIQVVLCGLVALLGTALNQAGVISVQPAFTVLASSIAVAAAILLALAGWLSADGSGVRIAFAVMVYGMVFLLQKAAEPDPAAYGLLIRDLTMIAVAVLFGLALRRSDVVDGVWRTSALAGIAVAGMVVAGTVFAQTRDAPPAAVVQAAIDVSTWVVTVLVGLALVFRGLQGRPGLQGRSGGQPLLRPVGVAFLTLAVAPSPIAELAGVAMLLVTAVSMVVRALRVAWREQAESESRLRAAEDEVARSAVRDHEMRNLVAGLSGAVNVLTDQQKPAGDAPDRSELHEATRAELERLRRMLARDQNVENTPPLVAVGPLLSGLAALHSIRDAASIRGVAIEVHVAEDSHVLMPPDCLSHIVTNLLVNCARHAPGARVWLTAYRHGDRVVIKVTDDGPGLPPGLTEELLAPGVRGPSSTGTGLGLYVSAQLVNRYRGAIRLVPTPVGCTVVVELPAATAGSLPLTALAV